EYAVQFQPQVIVQPRGGMLLHHEPEVFRRGDLEIAARFGGLAEVALGPVGGELCFALGQESLLPGNGPYPKLWAVRAGAVWDEIPANHSGSPIPSRIGRAAFRRGRRATRAEWPWSRPAGSRRRRAPDCDRRAWLRRVRRPRAR